MCHGWALPQIVQARSTAQRSDLQVDLWELSSCKVQAMTAARLREAARCP